MSKHTPGPWEPSLNRENVWQQAPNKENWSHPKLICRIERDDPSDKMGSAKTAEFQANAHLIAAAPDLYHALERLLWEMTNRGVPIDPLNPRLDPVVDDCYKAIAKAEGK